MCHDPATADRFYVSLPSKEAWYEMRKLRLKAMQKAFTNPGEDEDTGDDEESVLNTPQTSSDSDNIEPVYDDEPDSSSLESSEDAR